MGLPAALGAAMVYTPSPYATIAAYHGRDLQPGAKVIPTVMDAAGLLLSADGSTFYVGGIKDTVAAVDRASGRVLHTYQTQYRVYGGSLAVAPDQSQLYITTHNDSHYYLEVFNGSTGQSAGTVDLGGSCREFRDLRW